MRFVLLFATAAVVAATQTVPCNVADPYACDTDKREVCLFVNGQYRCLCPKGIARDERSQRCTIRNECSDPRLYVCDPNAECFDSLDGYRCICRPGYVDVSPGAEKGKVCRAKVNECADPVRYGVRCDTNAVCEDTEDGYTCSCLPGFRDVSFNYQLLQGQRCVQDVNECVSGSDCSDFADCVDQDEGYSCRCQSGYIDVSPNIRAYPGRVCQWAQQTYGNNYIRCTQGGNECNPGENCAFDIAASGYICKCPGGSVRYSDQSCRVVDACSAATDCHRNAVCSNIFDSYQCRCPSGFADTSPDPVQRPGRVCVRRDNECSSRNTNDCSPNAQCLDTVEGYSCKCNAGLLDVSAMAGLPPGRRCTRESNECSHRSLHSCDDNAECVDLPDSYACTCRAGFVDVGASANLPQGRSCTVWTYCPSQKTDLMFVIDGSGSIGATTFRNEVLRFVREVVELFDVGLDRTRIGAIQYSNMIRREFDMDDFATRNAVLNKIAGINYLSGLTRTGKAMETMVQRMFTTYNGARPQSSNVARIAILITDGQSQEPQEIDPAAQAALANGITTFAIGVTEHVDKEELVRITGGHRDRAFHVNDFTDLNIRLRSAIQKLACRKPDPDPCLPPRSCTCTPERHEGCARDLNEICRVDRGRNFCDCPDGWTRNPVTKVCGGDLCNPLVAGTCPSYSECIRTPYNIHRCRCYQGIQWNNRGTCGDDTCDPNNPNSCDTTRRQVCRQNSEGYYSCQCDFSYTLDPVTGSCTRNECLDQRDNDCDPAAKCVDTEQSYICQCPANYLDQSTDLVGRPGRKCVRKENECVTGRADCSPQGSECIDTEQSFFCRCLPGFTDRSPDPVSRPGRNCVRERDECTDGSATCSPNADCFDTRESYRCVCRNGFIDMDPLRLPGRNCQQDSSEQKDPCRVGGESNCHVNAECRNLQNGNFLCRCKYGYEGDGVNRCDPVTIAPTTPDPNKCGNTFCYIQRQEKCANGRCVCVDGAARFKEQPKRCIATVGIPLQVTIVREDNTPLLWDPAYGNPNSVQYQRIRGLFIQGLIESLGQVQIPIPLLTPDNSMPINLYNPGGGKPGAGLNFTVYVPDDSGASIEGRRALIFDQLYGYWRDINNGEVGNSGLFIDLGGGIPCGITTCRPDYGEICEQRTISCVCDPRLTKGNIIFGRNNPTEKCRELIGYTFPINVLKYYAEELNYNTSFAGINFPIARDLAKVFEDGIAQMFAEYDCGRPHVYSNVTNYREPEALNPLWNRGVVFNFTAYFDKASSKCDPRVIYNDLIALILRKYNARIGTSGLIIAPDQINPYSPCFTHTCDPVAICFEIGDGSKYQCKCPDGFTEGNANRLGGLCVPKVDYCNDGPFCPTNMKCVNRPGQGECVCDPITYIDIRSAPEDRRIALGYAGIGCLPPGDVRFCDLGLHNCSYYADCIEGARGYSCACQAGFTDIAPDLPGRLCAGEVCGLCRGNGDCVADPLTRNTTCKCFQGYTGDTCAVAIADLFTVDDLPGLPLSAGLIIALILAILFLLLALCCLGYFLAQTKCCGLFAKKYKAESYSSADYGYGQMTIPRARLARGYDDRASVYSGESEGSDYTVVERRIVTEEKKVTSVPATSTSGFLVYPPGTEVEGGIDLATLTESGKVQMITAKGASSSGLHQEAITSGSTSATNNRFSAFSAADSSQFTQDRDLEEYSDDSSVSDRSLPSTTLGALNKAYTDDPSGFQGTFDKHTTTKNTHDVVPGQRERFVNEVTTKSYMNRY